MLYWEAVSDVDLAVELDPAARIGLCGRVALERRLTDILGRPVDLLSEPVEKLRLRANIDRDRRRSFQARSVSEKGSISCSEKVTAQVIRQERVYHEGHEES